MSEDTVNHRALEFLTAYWDLWRRHDQGILEGKTGDALYVGTNFVGVFSPLGEAIKRAQEYGANTYLIKFPPNPKIRTLIQRSHSQAQTPYALPEAAE